VNKQSYAGGGIVKAIAGSVAREAPELARGAASRRAAINIGLDINGGEKLSPEQALAALQRMGLKPMSAKIAQSDTEPTLIIELDRALKADEAHALSAELQQEAIAQVDEFGVGDLHGPSADKWKPFNGDYFIDPSGKRLTQAIMDAGNGEVPGGADPVMQQLDEYLAQLNGQPVKKAGGGLLKQVAEGLMDVATKSEAAVTKPMRLYHGRSFREPIKKLDPFISANQLGIHLGDAETAGMFATIRDNVRPKDAGARVIPLDVDLKNPMRLMDNTGKWEPATVYKQLVDGGHVPFDRETESRLHWGSKGYTPDEEGTLIDDENAPLAAMLEVQDMIRGLGHDGVVYKNRHEFPNEAAQSRAEMRPRDQLNALSDEDFAKEFPETRDSYIAFRNEQLKSPFGEGPGVGYADGGQVQHFDKGGVVRKLGQGIVDLLDFSGSAGKPSHATIPGVGRVAAAPIGEIDDAAEAYMRKYGIPGTHRIDEYPEFDEEFARQVAGAYDAAPHAPNDPSIKRAYDALLDETMAQYKALEDTGLDVRFLKDGMSDPYAKSPSMGYADMVNNGRLWVFPTEQGYGSLDDIADNPLLKKVGRVGDKEDAVANDAFRVVHDAYGHFGPGNPFFRHTGEDRAWQHHARMFTDDALPAMTAETRGQNSWLNFGPYGEQNRKALGADTIFADQKATIMPPWVYERGLGRKPRFADGGQVPSDEDIASMTHDHSYGTGRDMNYLETLGTEVPLGEANFYDVDGERRMPEGVQGLHDIARLGVYGVPVVGPAVGATLDTTEAVAEDDPLSAGMAVAFGPGGKLAKGAMTGAMAYGMDPAEAEAGVFGKWGKWALSSGGRDALDEAQSLAKRGADNGDIMDATGWFKDVDGHWKYFRSSAGGGFNGDAKSGWFKDVYSDPHLFDEYPHMKDIRFGRKNNEGAHWDEANNRIVLGDTSKPGYNTPDMGGKYGAVTHEAYHAKASKEGWAQGMGSADGYSRMSRDIRILNGLPLTDPPGTVGGPKDRFSQIIGGNQNAASLGHKRYEAELGEVLARREASMREMTDEHMRGMSPATTGFLDVRPEDIFHPGQSPAQGDMAKYQRLLQEIEDDRAQTIADAKAWAEKVANATTPKRKK
jgi:hypothetical protein